MALYKNISGSACYICSGMTKIKVAPEETVELSERDLAHAGYALVNFESVAKAKDVEIQRMADLKRANRFVKPEVDSVPVEKLPDPVEIKPEIDPELVVESTPIIEQEPVAKPEPSRKPQNKRG